MKLSPARVAALLLSSSSLVAAQTFTDCNPLERTCPPDPAFGRSATFDFTKGPSGDFKPIGSPTYDSNGAAFTVAKQGDSPLIQSNWYIMFGRVDFQIKAAPGRGIVSSAVLQSDDLDEIDWEWLGGDDSQVQTNYFGKGNTQSFSRGAFHANPGNHDDFHTYTIDWTSEQIVWQIDGKTVRVVTPETAEPNQYPQSPMMIKVGVWAGGDPNNNPGTIQWSGGLTDYSAGPYTMYLKSMSVVDYSTGSQYVYSDHSGSWQSINAVDGQVNGNIGAAPKEASSAPPVTATPSDSAPIPWSGTHRETSSFVTPSEYPWIPKPTDGSQPTTYPGLPSGWTVTGDGRVQPPSAASQTSPAISSSSAFLSASSSPSGPTTEPASQTSSTGPSGSSASTNSAVTSSGTLVTKTTAAAAQSGTSTRSSHVAPSTGGANSNLRVTTALGSFCAFLGGAFALF